jgi:hypothetical protein
VQDDLIVGSVARNIALVSGCKPGNGDCGIEIAPNKHYFPDFIVETEPKVLEVGDTEYWHDHEEIRQRIRDYARVGYDCLYLTNEDIVEDHYKPKPRSPRFSITTMSLYKGLNARKRACGAPLDTRSISKMTRAILPMASWCRAAGKGCEGVGA